MTTKPAKTATPNKKPNKRLAERIKDWELISKPRGFHKPGSRKK